MIKMTELQKQLTRNFRIGRKKIIIIEMKMICCLNKMEVLLLNCLR